MEVMDYIWPTEDEANMEHIEGTAGLGLGLGAVYWQMALYWRSSENYIYKTHYILVILTTPVDVWEQHNEI